MKRLYLILMCAMFLFICTGELIAQEIETKLNQIELVKQWVGAWTGELTKDTTLNWEIKSCGTGLFCEYKYNGLKKLDRNLITLKFLSHEKIKTKIHG